MALWAAASCSGVVRAFRASQAALNSTQFDPARTSHPRLRLASVPIREHAYQAGCHQRRRRRRGGSGTGGAGGGKANRSAFCRKRSHSSRVSVSCARNSSETARNVAICASRTGVRSGVAFGTTVSPVAGWGDRIDPVQFGQLATFRRVNLVIVYPR